MAGEKSPAPESIENPVEPPVTGRIVDVLQLIADGLTNAQAARNLGIGEESVKTYVERALSRLPANNRAHAVAIALRRGLIK